jgi:micrococcal nuclease
MYNYRAQVANVVDGDTLDLNIDLGLEVHVQTRVRLAGLNAPERGTPEGTAATLFVKMWTAEVANGDVRITTVKDRKEKFGRYLAYIHPFTDLGLPVSLNQAMIQAGHALTWDGRGKRP